MNILIAGGSGFIGQQLTDTFVKMGHDVFILSRRTRRKMTHQSVKYFNYKTMADELPRINVVINLAGESLFGYWTKGKKRRILNSRIETTNKIIKLISWMKVKPELFINASAIGFYGISDEIIFSEKTNTPGKDFLANVVHQWEITGQKARELGVRTVFARFGLVLGKKGALPLMSLPIKLGLGGKIGSGEQYMSWIHIQDVVRLIIFMIEHEHIEGPVNFTAPNPKQNKYFIRTLARKLKRPTLIPAPKQLLESLLGEMSLLITEGQYVLPNRAKQYDFEFKYPTLNQALENLYD